MLPACLVVGSYLAVFSVMVECVRSFVREWSELLRHGDRSSQRIALLFESRLAQNHRKHCTHLNAEERGEKLRAALAHLSSP